MDYWITIEVSTKAKDVNRLMRRDSPLKQLRMTRVTCGTAYASYHFIRCLEEGAIETIDQLTQLTIKQDFYIDELFSGANNLDKTSSI